MDRIVLNLSGIPLGGRDRSKSNRDSKPRTLDESRRIASFGLLSYFVGLILQSVGNAAQIYPIVPFAIVLFALGYVLVVTEAVHAGASLRAMVVIGIIFGFGLFYVGEPHEVHVGSGLGFGLSHFPGHIVLGEVLITIATLVAASIAIRKKGAGIAK